jgi:hypothetical protein
VYCDDTRSSWEIIEQPVGTPVAVLRGQPGTAWNFTLPPPRVQLWPADQRIKGFTRSGVSVFGVGTLVIGLEGMPPYLLADPIYSARVELVRYTPKRSRVSYGTSGRRSRRMPQGFYHPVNYVGGVTPPPIAGTRSGVPSTVAVDRPTEWSVLGFGQYQRLSLSVAEVLVPFFEQVRVQDTFGGAVDALVYFNGNKRRSASGFWGFKGYGPNPSRGVFGFRYAFIDPVSGQCITGPMSERVFARPLQWPVQPTAGGWPVYPRQSTCVTPIIDPNTGAPQTLILCASIGGTVNGRLRG